MTKPSTLPAHTSAHLGWLTSAETKTNLYLFGEAAVSAQVEAAIEASIK
ncbi:hypothetical protein ACFSBG_16455 [Georgenia yuyongxinii]|nr:hypothetical protein [Georgenia yuyongxinii]